MFKEKINRRLKKIVIITAACTMMSMYGAPISSTEAAIRSHAPSVYVTPQNTAASDIISIDWSPVQTAPYTYWAVHNWNQGERVVVMLASNNKVVLIKPVNVLFILRFGIQ